MAWAINGTPVDGGSVNTLDIDDMDGRTFNHFLCRLESSSTTGSVACDPRFDGSSLTDYAHRLAFNGGTDSTATNQNRWNLQSAENLFLVYDVINIAGDEKIGIGHWASDANSTGAATAPGRLEWVGKWDQTSTQFTEANMTDDGAHTYTSNSNFSAIGTD